MKLFILKSIIFVARAPPERQTPLVSSNHCHYDCIAKHKPDLVSNSIHYQKERDKLYVIIYFIIIILFLFVGVFHLSTLQTNLSKEKNSTSIGRIEG